MSSSPVQGRRRQSSTRSLPGVVQTRSSSPSSRKLSKHAAVFSVLSISHDILQGEEDEANTGAGVPDSPTPGRRWWEDRVQEPPVQPGSPTEHQESSEPDFATLWRRTAHPPSTSSLQGQTSSSNSSSLQADEVHSSASQHPLSRSPTAQDPPPPPGGVHWRLREMSQQLEELQVTSAMKVGREYNPLPFRIVPSFSRGQLSVSLFLLCSLV